MKPTHDNLRAEIEHRLALLHNEEPIPIIEYENSVMLLFYKALKSTFGIPLPLLYDTINPLFEVYPNLSL